MPASPSFALHRFLRDECKMITLPKPPLPPPKYGAMSTEVRACVACTSGSPNANSLALAKGRRRANRAQKRRDATHILQRSASTQKYLSYVHQEEHQMQRSKQSPRQFHLGESRSMRVSSSKLCTSCWPLARSPCKSC